MTDYDTYCYAFASTPQSLQIRNDDDFRYLSSLLGAPVNILQTQQ